MKGVERHCYRVMAVGVVEEVGAVWSCFALAALEESVV